MKTIIPVSLLVCGALSGCSDINANSAMITTTKFDGAWQVGGGTKTARPGEDDKCGYGIGDGTLTIKGGRVSGNLTDNSGYAYALEGVIQDSGKMEGEFTYEGYDAATFEGLLSAAKGGGSWKDINGCPGTWQATRKESVPADPVNGKADITPSS